MGFLGVRLATVLAVIQQAFSYTAPELFVVVFFLFFCRIPPLSQAYDIEND